MQKLFVRYLFDGIQELICTSILSNKHFLLETICKNVLNLYLPVRVMIVAMH